MNYDPFPVSVDDYSIPFLTATMGMYFVSKFSPTMMGLKGVAQYAAKNGFEFNMQYYAQAETALQTIWRDILNSTGNNSKFNVGRALGYVEANIYSRSLNNSIPHVLGEVYRANEYAYRFTGFSQFSKNTNPLVAAEATELKALQKVFEAVARSDLETLATELLGGQQVSSSPGGRMLRLSLKTIKEAGVSLNFDKLFFRHQEAIGKFRHTLSSGFNAASKVFRTKALEYRLLHFGLPKIGFWGLGALTLVDLMGPSEEVSTPEEPRLICYDYSDGGGREYRNNEMQWLKDLNMIELLYNGHDFRLSELKRIFVNTYYYNERTQTFNRSRKCGIEHFLTKKLRGQLVDPDEFEGNINHQNSVVFGNLNLTFDPREKSFVRGLFYYAASRGKNE